MKASAILTVVLLPLGASLVAIAQAQAATPAATVVLGPARAATGESSALFRILPDARAGVPVLLPVPGPDGVMARYLYTPSIAGGLGASELGLDRARLGQTQVLVLRKVGNRVIAAFENTRFRALNGDAGEAEAVARSFSASPVWSGAIVSEDARGVVVDLAGFLMRDAMGVAARLKAAKAGTFRLAADLSHVDPAQSLAFPDNVEFETELAFTAEDPSRAIERVLPDGRGLALRIHHSFIRLPGAGFHPREHDPRTGTSVQVIRNNYAAALDQPVVTRLVRRFRLEKTDPGAARSRVRKPIVFYVDRAAPEAIRTALMEGAQWWTQAFDDAGFIDAFRVEELPEGVNPMDARYNVIAWVHRETRGWSTGATIVDPRTGEIVRGVVQLGSLRAWQDKLIFEGLAGTAHEGTGASDDPLVLTRARLRLLAVHEVGHALGLSHNFAASTFADRASVMDYPSPRIAVREGKLDFSDAYAKGVGAWDRFAIDWLYSQFAPGTDEAGALDAMVRSAQGRGYRFVADGDTRGDGDLQPYAAMWDDGPDAVAALRQALAVRGVALAKFGLANLPRGAADADLRRALVPIYLFHRYEVTSASKLVAGLDYGYAVKGDGHERAEPVPPARQRAALDALLDTLSPQVLDLPDGLIPLLSSVQSGTPDQQSEIEQLPGQTAAAFDWARAAEVGADATLFALLAPERVNRLVLQHAEDPHQLSLEDVLGALDARVLSEAQASTSRRAEIARRVRSRYVARLLALGDGKALSVTAGATVRAHIAALAVRLGDGATGASPDAALDRDLARLLSAPPETRAAFAAPILDPVPVPPGAPIGDDGACWLCTVADQSDGNASTVSLPDPSALPF